MSRLPRQKHMPEIVHGHNLRHTSAIIRQPHIFPKSVTREAARVRMGPSHGGRASSWEHTQPHRTHHSSAPQKRFLDPGRQPEAAKGEDPNPTPNPDFKYPEKMQHKGKSNIKFSNLRPMILIKHAEIIFRAQNCINPFLINSNIINSILSGKLRWRIRRNLKP